MIRSGSRSSPLLLILSSLLTSLAGCGWAEVDTTYGRSRGQSINGTNVFAGLIRARGHEVRVALRNTESLAEWANVIVRFAPYPGAPAEREAKWLSTWLQEGPGRKLVYIPRDCDTTTEFYDLFLAEMDPKAPAADRTKAQFRRDEGRHWPKELPPKATQPARIDDWFGVTKTRSDKPEDVTTCTTLSGPWADGIDARAAALPDHEAIRVVNDEPVLFRGDGRDLAVTWRFRDEDGDETGSVLILANAAYLLNAGLLNPARRPLADRVVDWIGDGPGHVAFLEGSNILAESPPGQASPFRLLGVEPFNWIAGHLGAFGLLLCLALAVRLGRPRPDPPEGIERSSAHPIALGAILARTRQPEVAAAILADYRRWRQATGAGSAPASASASVSRPQPDPTSSIGPGGPQSAESSRIHPATPHRVPSE